ncbi:glycoside hydrolase family 13 protein [Flagellimonas algicola]|uniref:Alpha-amylase n=1 Tax=Flagellimonas algicola TaxID=2583815 RepID=A0ABY2WGH0_9FLAO|nr:glycoside hydrolase family 13 protein [Allomuricauda algicola]TMU50394.1 alpha-amylase [Allomuricauda algicola]
MNLAYKITSFFSLFIQKRFRSVDPKNIRTRYTIVIGSIFFSLFLLDCSTKESNDKEFVPQWAKDAIWYQIFPERFRNGDPSNDPTIEDLASTYPLEMPKEWRVHPWGSDWYELQPYEQENGEKELWKHLLRRRYGGDLQGIINKLDYLDDLGINAIYLNPIFDSPSMHKYDGNSYHHVDPNFGPDPEGDRKLMESEDPIDPSTWIWTKADQLALKLIKEAHKRDMKIIFDGVFNHLGIKSFAFQDLEKNQQNSKYKDWFIVKSWRDSATNTAFEYKGWNDVQTLPELKEDENGIVQGPKDYIFNATARWMNPKNQGIENGIDGWRLDVAFCVGHNFWKDWRKYIKKINPDAYITAELVLDEERTKPYFQGDEFDGEMNYNFAFTCAEFFFNTGAEKIGASQFDRKLKNLRELFPKGVAEVSQNLFSSHDANRVASHVVNRGIGNYRDWWGYYEVSKAANNPGYEVRKPNREEIELQKLFILFQMTYVGAPMIYYGEEVGMWGANDPDCRKPMIWDDIQFQDETFNPDGSIRHPDEVKVNQQLAQYYKQLIAIRTREASLRRGTFNTIISNDRKNVFAFERRYGKEVVTVVINNGDETISLKTLGFTDCYTDLVTGRQTHGLKPGIPAYSGVILKKCGIQ